ncbi:hypothetical protein F8M41_023907 [Gigaspora margarita]|uniref:Uncharacterized protein n=1 Tax=Gigaspora margarita TaxID=4874 RepID=A0A8H4ACK1_GIGMA|nr:hypothetical protein F8M41_023907 [Gigaspora margarita]
MCLTKIKAEGLIYYLQSLQPTFKMSWHFGKLGGLIKPSTCGTFSTSSTIEEMIELYQQSKESRKEMDY